MQTLGLDDEFEYREAPKTIKENASTGFWSRQFQIDATHKQRVFDWLFGVIVPVVCFAFDPIVFKGRFESGLLGAFRPFAYILSFASIMAMMAWLLWGARLKWLNGFLSGLFGVGGIISFSLGIILLPWSLMGLIILIGALGFTPFFSSVIYLRNAVRAYRAAVPFFERRVLISTFLLAALYSVVISATINIEIRKELDRMRFGNEAVIREGAAKLKLVRFLVEPDPLARAYYRLPERERTSDRAMALAKGFKELSGANIEDVRWIFDNCEKF